MKLKQFRLVKFVISLAAVARGGPGGGGNFLFLHIKRYPAF